MQFMRTTKPRRRLNSWLWVKDGLVVAAQEISASLALASIPLTHCLLLREPSQANSAGCGLTSEQPLAKLISLFIVCGSKRLTSLPAESGEDTFRVVPEPRKVWPRISRSFTQICRDAAQHAITQDHGSPAPKCRACWKRLAIEQSLDRAEDILRRASCLRGHGARYILAA